jgi:aminoglycoside phosphotransferase (APT) family kinase protein
MIDSELVRRLVATQFPQWKDLPVRPVASGGWDNRTFHLGESMLVRLPSAANYASQVEKEHRWLPMLAPLLPIRIPEPLAHGDPGEGYPWGWSIYGWLKGETAATATIDNLREFAASLAHFLIALQGVDTTGGPPPGPHSFFRGASLTNYDDETRKAIIVLKDKIDVAAATKVWEAGLASTWQHAPVWVHGDISTGNLLVGDGRLSAVIDFGQLTVGDPACDLAITWTFFEGEAREIFRSMLPLDIGTWDRARAWTLWKALTVAAGNTNPGNAESKQCWRIIHELLT